MRVEKKEQRMSANREESVEECELRRERVEKKREEKECE